VSNLLYSDREVFHYIYNDRLYTIVPIKVGIRSRLTGKIKRPPNVILKLNMKKGKNFYPPKERLYVSDGYIFRPYSI